MSIVKNKLETIWISWEKHRRTEEIAKALDIKLFEILYSGGSASRYIFCLIKTSFLIVKFRPRNLIVQNPSIILTTYSLVLKYFFGFQLIVDRHTSFKFETRKSNRLKARLFHHISDMTIRGANFTIVTNQALANFIEVIGGKSIVLPDKVPEMTISNRAEGCSDYFLFVSSMGQDECLYEAISAFKEFPKRKFFITGNYKKAIKNGDVWLCNVPNNVFLTGFVPNEEYVALMKNSYAVIVITTNEYTLTCGAYEAISLDKPTVLGDTETIRNYFKMGSCYTDGTIGSTTAAINKVIDNYDKLKLEVSAQRNKMNFDWDVAFQKLKNVLKE